MSLKKRGKYNGLKNDEEVSKKMKSSDYSFESLEDPNEIDLDSQENWDEKNDYDPLLEEEEED